MDLPRQQGTFHLRLFAFAALLEKRKYTENPEKVKKKKKTLDE